MRRSGERSWVVSGLALLACAAWPIAKASGDECAGKGPLCYEQADYAFRVILDVEFKAPDADDRAMLTRLPRWMGSFVAYLDEHPGERLFAAALYPLPDAHQLLVTWNAALRLKSGETVDAVKWLVLVDEEGPLEENEPGSVLLSTAMIQKSRAGKALYRIVISFPSRTASGYRWREKDVVGLVIR